MAIQYSGGTVRNDLYAGVSTYPLLLTNINTTLVAAGWTSTPLPGFNNLIYTGQPLNNETVTLNSVVYTFKTVINNPTPREILIGASADISFQNFVNCVIAGPGSGSAYSSATTVNPTFVASIPSAGTVRVETIATGPSLSLLAASETLTNASWQKTRIGTPNFAFYGYKWTSAATPAGHRINVFGWLRDFDTGPNPLQARFVLSDESESFVNPVNYLGNDLSAQPNERTYGARLGANNATIPTTTWRVIADKYQMFVFGNTIYTGAVYLAAGVPWIPDFLYPKVVSSVAAGSPGTVTTTTSHGYTTGDVVSISGINGSSGANGNFTITVTGATTFTLGASTVTGTYTSGGVVGKINAQVANIGWMVNMFGGTSGTFYTNNVPTDYVAQLINGSINNVNGSIGTGTFSLVIANDTRVQEGADAQFWYNNDTLATEPLISMGTGDAGISYLVGQLWDSFFHCKTEAGGITGSFDGRNWYLLTNNATGSTSEKEGALVLLVP